MSPVVARDAVAADQLVYPWPYPLGSAIEVACADGEVAVMCPAWAVGDRLGPGRHNWQSPDPSKPVSVYFVLTGPVQVPFAMRIEFPLPAAGQTVTLQAFGSVLVQVTDPGLLDNLIGGGVPHGQTPAETLLREGWEEAGLLPHQMSGLRAGHVLRVARDIPEGFQL